MGLFHVSRGDLRAYYLGFLVCIGGLLFGYDTGVVGLYNPPSSSTSYCLGDGLHRRPPGGTITLPSYKSSFGFADSSPGKKTQVESLTVGLQQCGSFVGCFAVFPLASRFGRRPCMQFAALIFVIGAAVQTADTGAIASFYAGRIIAGLGVGAASVLVPLYSSEMSPKELRGRIGSGYQWLFTWGIFTSYW